MKQPRPYTSTFSFRRWTPCILPAAGTCDVAIQLLHVAQVPGRDAGLQKTSKVEVTQLHGVVGCKNKTSGLDV